MSTQGFVLAGGKSTRMGRDKAMIEWHGRTMLDHMVALLSSITHPVQVVGRDPLPDRVPDRGPMGGIATALEVSEMDAILVVAVDLPHLTEDFLKYFRFRLENSQAALVACNIGSRFPLCLGLHKELLPDVRQRLERGLLSIHSFVRSNSPDLISEIELNSLGFTPRLFTNINTPEDFE